MMKSVRAAAPPFGPPPKVRRSPCSACRRCPRGKGCTVAGPHAAGHPGDRALLVILAMLGVAGRGLSLAAMVVILAGTIGLVLAVSSGGRRKSSPTAFRAGRDPRSARGGRRTRAQRLLRGQRAGDDRVLRRRSPHGQQARRHAPPAGAWIGQPVLLAATGAGYLMLANVGHLGGQLVHGVGCSAPIVALPPRR